MPSSESRLSLPYGVSERSKRNVECAAARSAAVGDAALGVPKQVLNKLRAHTVRPYILPLYVNDFVGDGVLDVPNFFDRLKDRQRRPLQMLHKYIIQEVPASESRVCTTYRVSELASESWIALPLAQRPNRGLRRRSLSGRQLLQRGNQRKGEKKKTAAKVGISPPSLVFPSALPFLHLPPLCRLFLFVPLRQTGK